MRLPPIWQSAHLSDVITDMQPGFAQRPNLENVGVPQLRTNNISSEGRIDLAEIINVRATEEDMEKYAVQKGDVIFNNTNSVDWVGKTAYFDREEPCVLSNHMTRIRVRESLLDSEFLARYLHYLWRNGFSQHRAKQWINQAAIDQDGLAKFPLPLPPISEQRRIAEILREADEIRRLRQQANERAQQLLPALFQEMFGDPVENPMRWQQKPLGNYIVFLTSGSRGWAKYYASKGARFIRVQDLAGLGFDLSHASCVIPPETSEARRAKIKPGDLLFSITGVIGQVAVAPYDIGDAYVSQHVAIVRLQEEVLNPTFVSAFLAHKTGGQMQIYRSQYEQTKPGFGLQDIEALQIFLPPKELQDDFASKVSEIRQLEMLHENSCQHSNTLFHSLLARAFTGELTAAWREEHAEMLSMEALERDLLLKGRSTPRTPEPGVAAAEMDMQAREVLVADMSNEQQRMLQAVLATDGYMTTPPPLQNGFSPLSPRLQRQGLELLAATGVVAQVALPIQPDGTVTFYPTAYRRLLPDDDSRDDDLQALEEQHS